jgi:hypothetical protein
MSPVRPPRPRLRRGLRLPGMSVQPGGTVPDEVMLRGAEALDVTAQLVTVPQETEKCPRAAHAIGPVARSPCPLPGHSLANP